MKTPRRAFGRPVVVGAFAPALGLALCLAAAGCSGPADDLPREPVSGTVNFGGEPLAKGVIQFHPATQAEGVAASAAVNAGQFDIPKREGLVPGKYSVQVFTEAESPAPELAPGELPGAINVPKKRPQGLIPARYNVKTELTAQVQPGQPNSFKFDLSK